LKGVVIAVVEVVILSGKTGIAFKLIMAVEALFEGDVRTAL
jgi:hypothetical protein